MKTKRKKHLYLVGFDGEIQTLYGREEKGVPMFMDPMTLLQATRKMKSMMRNDHIQIYKIVPILDQKKYKEISK